MLGLAALIASGCGGAGAVAPAETDTHADPGEASSHAADASQAERSEPESDLAPEDSREFTACLSQARSGNPWNGDSLILLQPANDSAWAPLIEAVEDNGHTVVDELRGIGQLIVDVREPDTVFSWLCQYKLSSSTRALVSDGWVNTSLRTTDER